MGSSIPQSRIVTYILIFGLLPVIWTWMQTAEQNRRIEGVLRSADALYGDIWSKEARQSLNKLVREHYRDADHFYIDKHLEPLLFLEDEVKSLEKIVNYEGFQGDELIRKRLDFLTDGSNNLAFSEGTVQSYPQFQETLESTVHPVEVNVSDIQKILSRIEGVPIGPWKPADGVPQLIITDFKIERKQRGDHDEVFSLTTKILKREFL